MASRVRVSDLSPENAPSEKPASVTPRRILHIIKHCGYGNGSVHVAIDLACMQSRAGQTVTVVSSGGTFVPLLERYDVEHIVQVHDQTRPLTFLGAVAQLTRHVRKARPDVIHAHMMSSALVGYLVSKLTGVPLVTTVHNSFDRHSIIMRLGRRIVAVSSAEKAQLIAQGYPADRVDLVPNAPVHSPRKGFFGFTEAVTLQSPSIITACGLHRRKGVFDLIAAFATLRDLPQWKLYIAGEGPDREALEAQVCEAGLKDNVIFLGFVREPHGVLEQADIFVLASHIEPFGLSLAEARAAGCAIVATEVGGMPEIVDFGKAGHLVPPGNPVRLAAALRILMSNDTIRTQLRSAAYIGSEIFHVHRLVEGYDEVYRQVQT